MNAIQRVVRGDWPALNLVSTNIPIAAEAFYADSILASSLEILTICLGPSKAVFLGDPVDLSLGRTPSSECG